MTPKRGEAASWAKCWLGSVRMRSWLACGMFGCKRSWGQLCLMRTVARRLFTAQQGTIHCASNHQRETPAMNRPLEFAETWA
jgi:hypothetical protein